MIKFLPDIYPDEAVYSYLSRCYARSGYIWNKGFTQEIFEKPTANIDGSFLNVFTPAFRQLLEDNLNFERIVLDHTLFKYYARFLPLAKRKEALKRALNNEPTLSQYLPIPLHTNTSCLRYCPECVKEDRSKYNEAYIHITHTIPHVNICAQHCCKLIDVEFIKNKADNRAFVPLEFALHDTSITSYDRNDINVKVAQYITHVFCAPLNMRTELIIGNLLSNKLGETYISHRGEQRNLEKIFQDMQDFYSELYDFDITKNRLAYIYRNLSLNPYDILLISFFQGLSPAVLYSCQEDYTPRHVAFDQKVRDMHQAGLGIHKIAQALNVGHEVVRQILLGTYDKPKHACSTYKCQKWDWDKIDDDCCKEFYNKIISLNKSSITKNTVAALFGLQDKRLRNLPRLNALIREYKQTQS